MGDVMAASDVDADAIEVEGRVCRRVLRSRQTYMTASGEVVVERWLYKDRADPTAHALAALDLRLGIVEGFWTQRAAEQAPRPCAARPLGRGACGRHDENYTLPPRGAPSRHCPR